MIGNLINCDIRHVRGITGCIQTTKANWTHIRNVRQWSSHHKDVLATSLMTIPLFVSIGTRNAAMTLVSVIAVLAVSYLFNSAIQRTIDELKTHINDCYDQADHAYAVHNSSFPNDIKGILKNYLNLQ